MAKLDPIIHAPARLRTMATLGSLSPGEKVDFTWLRDRLGVTDGNLGAHLQKLEEAGYIKVEKKFVLRKPRTFLSATARGRAAFEDHASALRSIIEHKT